MQDQMFAWIQEYGMWVVLQQFRYALIKAIGSTASLDQRNKMAALANYIGQKV